MRRNGSASYGGSGAAACRKLYLAMPLPWARFPVLNLGTIDEGALLLITEDLAELIRNAVLAAQEDGEFAMEDISFIPVLEKPANKQHGDYACNIALVLKKATGLKDSREIAARIVKRLPVGGPLIDHVEIAGPGFINLYLKPDWLHDTLVRVEAEDEAYGRSNLLQGERIILEFVSANPTGPISVVNGRAAVLGDVLGNLLQSQGAHVEREFYINDALNSLQLELFAQTVAVRYGQQLGHAVSMPSSEEGEAPVVEPGFPVTNPTKATLYFPMKGYRGEYVRDIARSVVDEVGDRYEGGDEAERNAFFRQATLHRMVAAQKAALEAFGIQFDTWFYESSLYQAGEVDRTIAHLRERGYAYEKDGALWLKSSDLGDEKDRVLIRSNEKATYVAADAAYHDNKLRRGATRLIDIWGADHHGYVARLKAGIQALGYDPRLLEIILTQMVSLVRDGEAVVGGKRKGNVIELKEDLIDDIGRDAARFYFLLNSYETPATVDVELAKKQSSDNPVYYVQYAHARLFSILRKASEQGLPMLPSLDTERSLLDHPAELDVLRKLTDYPAEVAQAAKDYAPHRLTRYGIEMAGLLNVFYENCRVLPGKEENLPPELTAARLALVNAARIVMRNLLSLLGINAPEKM